MCLSKRRKAEENARNWKSCHLTGSYELFFSLQLMNTTEILAVFLHIFFNFPPVWLSYSVPTGIHTVHVYMITSSDDTHWDMQCVHVHRDISVLAPSTQFVWIEYICIMDFHTLQSL